MIKKILLIILALAVTVTPTTLLAKAPPPADETILTQIPKESSIEEELSLMSLYFTEAELQVVEAPTRYPKPITQVAENVTIITHKEIAKWNVHSVAEILKRVAGVFVSFRGHEVNNDAIIHVHGSDYEHVQVFVDGIKWNEMLSDFNSTYHIPVRIIDRIEIIKGPASSSWGSAFGGVINIITRDGGKTEQPTGDIFVSYGEENSREISGDVAGRVGMARYYLYADNLDSDGLRGDRYHDNESLFGKVALDLPRDIDLTLSLGHTRPDYRYYYNKTWDDANKWEDNIQFMNSGLSIPITKDLHFNTTFGILRNKYLDYRYTISTGAPYWDLKVSQKSYNGSSRLSWKHGRHQAVLGSDYYRSRYIRWEDAWVVNATERAEENWSVYLNDTIKWGDAAITPGIRYDSLSIADSRTSPSLGVTYMLNDANLLRLHVARGFRKPAVGLKNMDAIDIFAGLTPSSALESEKVWTYQLGLESVAMEYFRTKLTLFRHDAEDTWDNDRLGYWINEGDITRQGFELEIETIPFYDLSVVANYTYVHNDFDYGADHGSTCAGNLIVKYDDNKSLHAYLAGTYIWWNGELSTATGDHDNMIWDATVNKTIYAHNGFSADLFANVHNLFNGSHYTDTAGLGYNLNAKRWVEGGLKLHF